MFHIDATDEEGYRESLLEQVVLEIRKLRGELSKNNVDYEELGNYQTLQGIKGIIRDGNNLKEALEECKKVKLNPSEKAYDDINKVLNSILAVLEDPSFKAIFPTAQITRVDSPEKASTQKSTIIEHSLFTQIKSGKDTLRYQVNNMNIPEVIKDEMVLLLMYKAKEENENYNGFFLDVNAITSCADTKTNMDSIKGSENKLEETTKRQNKVLFDEITKIMKFCEQNNINRAQIILRSGVHYTALDINLEKKSCLVLDAAGDAQKYRYHKICKFCDFIQHVYDATNKDFIFDGQKRNSALQKDKFSCPIFSLDQSEEAAKIENLHDTLSHAAVYNQKSEIYNIDWDKLPPSLVKCSQSTVFLDYYKSLNPDKTDNIDLLTNNNSRTYAFDKTLGKYTKSVLDVCNNCSETEIKTMIDSIKIIDPKSSLKLRK